MRVSLPTLLSVAISLVSIVNAHQDHTLEAREYIDELIAREEAYNALERRDLFADISTRELIDELSDRFERRAGNNLKLYQCEYCHQSFDSKDDAKKDAKKFPCQNSQSKDGKHKVKATPKPYGL
ncbi:ectomycorrhizas-regulated small secreted protein [Ephemerocybe angulata]|uniref:Ectomycorrhizas-regulated small secreted protein n=1 Tax=Ephemerocybe angulata TaxID=980116 RepID=A0A8H6HFX4_9AGAR|nr:ectomycorrhizas-regulated small secreted protein [Tulosesus angulatus]